MSLIFTEKLSYMQGTMNIDQYIHILQAGIMILAHEMLNGSFKVRPISLSHS